MSRKPLNELEREQKKLFEQELKKYSIDCLKQIYKIATTAVDMSTRLKANIWLLEKLFGKNYQCYKDETDSLMNKIDVNINVVKGNPSLDIINANTECEDSDNWNEDDSDEWGTDVYISK